MLSLNDYTFSLKDSQIKKNDLSLFKQNGFLIKKSLFSKSEILEYVQDYDKIISQLKEKSKNINASWKSPLTKDVEPKDSKVIHTHHVQSYSSKMLSMIQNKKLLDIFELLIGPDIILHHSKLFLKPPKVGAAFPLHQDWSYFPTKNNSMIAAVVHLSSSTERMGCFRIIPGSNKYGKLEKSDGHSFNSKIHNKYTLENAMPIIAKKGDVLFFDALSIHGSLPNVSNRPRKTILIQVYSGKDEIISENNHTNIQLVLRGFNYHATRESVDNI